MPPMPPKRKTLTPKNQPPLRSSGRLKSRMSTTSTTTAIKNDKSSISPIDLSTPTPPPEKKKNKRAKNHTPSAQKDDETPIRHHLIVTNEEDVKHFEELDDCFILGFDPIDVNNVTSAALMGLGSPEIAIVGEKGKVACRDYPHSRNLCIKFPFQTTAHEKYCELCYCYVCDTAAPCKSWSAAPCRDSLLSHCNAYDSNDIWKRERELKKKVSTVFRQ